MAAPAQPPLTLRLPYQAPSRLTQGLVTAMAPFECLLGRSWIMEKASSRQSVDFV